MSYKPDLAKLQRKLQYQFRDETWLILALTHRSKAKLNYERLEFLGDSLLGFIISDHLYHHFSDQPEGVLTRLRANVVRQRSLANVAKAFDFSDYLILGDGEGKSGGYYRDSILADVLEAVIAAIYLDSGLDETRQFIESVFADHLGSLDTSKSLKDPKSRLQEWLQKRSRDVPDYQVISISGEEHKKEFEIECSISDLKKTFDGTAGNRRRAEQIAAKKALEYLTKKQSDDK